jgi:AraC-like DNA-binding protein
MSQRCHSILRDRGGRLVCEVASVSANLEDGHFIREHSHPEDQLLFASTGVMTVRTRAGIWVVPPLRAVWIPANTPHSVAISGNVSMRTLYFLPKLCGFLSRKCLVIGVPPLLRELILHACSFGRLRRRSPVERRLIEIVVDQMHAVERVPLQLPYPHDARAMRIVDVLAGQPGDGRTLEELCRVCGATKRTIQRVFLEQTGMTFARWRQQLRLLHGLERLAHGDKVSSAALAAGYRSASAFISVFQKQLAATPIRYLQTDKEKQSSRRNGRRQATPVTPRQGNALSHRRGSSAVGR